MSVRRLLGCAVVLLLAATASLAGAVNLVEDGLQGPARRPGRLILRRDPHVPRSAVAAALAANGARMVSSLDALDATLVEVPEVSLPGAEAALRGAGVFRSVERDYVARIAELPNDPYLSAQWGLTHILAPQAWTLSTGSGVRVAVIDTGIDATHPDLQGQVLAGYDFVNNDVEPLDDHGHGTRMAGIIAALSNNAAGIAGVAPQAELLPVKVLDDQGYGSYSDIASGIIYAVDNGARVLNLSLSGSSQSAVLQDAVDYATARGAVVVAAAGNDGWDYPAYPAAAQGAVAVSAINEADAHPGFSNYGDWIDVAAPGVDILTTSIGQDYASSTGTSPATAFASAVFALLLSAEPSLTGATALARVTGRATDLGANGWDPYYGWGLVDAYDALLSGNDPSTADNAPPQAHFLTPKDGSLLSGATTLEVAASDDVGITRVELYVDRVLQGVATAPPYLFALDAAALEPGKHRLRAVAYDAVGNGGRTRTVRVLSTTGQGLLVSRVVATAGRLRMNGTFALPAGTVFDPTRDVLELTVSEAGGTMLAFTIEPGSTGSSGGRAFEATVAPTVPAGGAVKLMAKPGAAPGVYTLKVRASQLAGSAAPAADMQVALTVGGTALNQSVTARSRTRGP